MLGQLRAISDFFPKRSRIGEFFVHLEIEREDIAMMKARAVMMFLYFDEDVNTRIEMRCCVFDGLILKGIGFCSSPLRA